MTALPPLLPGGSSPRSAIPLGVLTLVEAPAELGTLPAGTRLAGTVLSGETRTGRVAIKTAFGILLGESTLLLPRSAAVSLLVQTAAPGMVLRIAQAPSLPAARSSVMAAGGQATAVTAAVSGNKTEGAIGPETAESIGATTTRIEAILLKPWAGVRPHSTAGFASPIGTAAEPDAASLLPAGTRLGVRIVAYAPTHAINIPSADILPPPPAHACGGSIISANLIGIDGAGRPLLASSSGPLVLATPVQLPPQWRGHLEIVELQGPQSTGMPTEVEETGQFQWGPRWRTLDEILGVLGQVAPQTAIHLRETVLPQPNASLAADFLKILGCLRHGDIRGWLGADAHEVLARGRPDLLEQLGSEMRAQASRVDVSVNGEWRIFSLPLVVGGAHHAITMLVRNHRQREQASRQRGGESTRFVLDLTLSRLGRMQIDGLLQDQGKQLDLIIRTGCPLARDVQGGIRHILAEATTVTGLRAAVCFHAAPAPFLDIAVPSQSRGHRIENLVV